MNLLAVALLGSLLAQPHARDGGPHTGLPGPSTDAGVAGGPLERSGLVAPRPGAQLKTSPPPETSPADLLSPDEVQVAVTAVTGALQRCYEEALTRDRPDSGGVLVMEFTIGAKGAVVATSSTVRKGVFSGQLRACLAAAIGRVITRPPGGTVRVRYPFTFSAR